MAAAMTKYFGVVMVLLVSAILIILDQITKVWAAQTFVLGGQGRYVGLGFYFTYVRNSGAAFGILQDLTLPLAILSAVVAAIILVYLLFQKLPPLQRAALTLIFAGAVGNMIDRFRLGYVIDFIHFNVGNFSFPVFNVADICVVVGAGLLLISSLFHPKRTHASESPERNLSEAEFFSELDR
jgi:signal peptidase II